MKAKTDLEKRQSARRCRNGLTTALNYLFLSVWAVLVLFPFYWMVLTSLKGTGPITRSTPRCSSPSPHAGEL